MSFSLKEHKSQGCLFKTGQNFAVGKTLVWLAFFFKKRVIYELGVISIKIRFI